MTQEEEIIMLRARVLVLETELARARSQKMKAYKQRADIHARLMKVVSQLEDQASCEAASNQKSKILNPHSSIHPAFPEKETPPADHPA